MVARLVNKFLASDGTQKFKKISTTEYSCSAPDKHSMTLVIFL